MDNRELTRFLAFVFSLTVFILSISILAIIR